MRLDVREATEAVAAAEFLFNGTCIALVSAELVDEWSDWSEPVQLKCVRHKDGLVDFEVRSFAQPSAEDGGQPSRGAEESG